jgi:hypothetical protein
MRSSCRWARSCPVQCIFHLRSVHTTTEPKSRMATTLDSSDRRLRSSSAEKRRASAVHFPREKGVRQYHLLTIRRWKDESPTGQNLDPEDADVSSGARRSLLHRPPRDCDRSWILLPLGVAMNPARSSLSHSSCTSIPRVRTSCMSRLLACFPLLWRLQRRREFEIPGECRLCHACRTAFEHPRDDGTVLEITAQATDFSSPRTLPTPNEVDIRMTPARCMAALRQGTWFIAASLIEVLIRNNITECGWVPADPLLEQ